MSSPSPESSSAIVINGKPYFYQRMHDVQNEQLITYMEQIRAAEPAEDMLAERRRRAMQHFYFPDGDAS